MTKNRDEFRKLINKFYIAYILISNDQAITGLNQLLIEEELKKVKFNIF